MYRLVVEIDGEIQIIETYSKREYDYHRENYEVILA